MNSASLAWWVALSLILIITHTFCTTQFVIHRAGSTWIWISLASFANRLTRLAISSINIFAINTGSTCVLIVRFTACQTGSMTISSILWGFACRTIQNILFWNTSSAIRSCSLASRTRTVTWFADTINFDSLILTSGTVAWTSTFCTISGTLNAWTNCSSTKIVFCVTRSALSGI